MDQLVTQSSWRPTRKVAAGGIGGLVTAIALAVAEYYGVAVAFEPLITLAGSVISAWSVRDRVNL